MKAIVHLAGFASAFALALGQETRNASTSSASQSDAIAIRAVDAGHQAFLAAMLANDPNALVKLLAPDVVFYPPNTSPVKGPEGVRAWFRAFLDKMKTTGVSVSDRTVTVAGGYAFEDSALVWKMTPLAGGAPMEHRGRQIAIWQRQADGGWKMVREIWNSSVPLPAAGGTTAADPWLGTWVLNVAQTRINPGPKPRSETRTYTATTDGEKATYDRVDADGKRIYQEAVYKFDGKHVALVGNPDGETQALTRTGPRSAAGEGKKDGKVVRTATRDVSADGKTLTVQFKGTNTKGQPIIEEVWVFDRQTPAQ